MINQNNLILLLLSKKGKCKGSGYNFRRWSFWTLLHIKWFNSNEPFQINDDYESENARRRQNFFVKFVFENYYIYLFLKYILCDQVRGAVMHKEMSNRNRYFSKVWNLLKTTKTRIYIKTYYFILIVLYTLNCNVSWICRNKD